MSSGVEADVVLDAAVVLSLGVTRVAGKAAGLTAAGTRALAAAAQGRADARAAALAEIERQDRAVREVIDRNAQIAALAEAQQEAGTQVPLPAPLPPDDRSPEELEAWCEATDRALAEARRRISEHVAADVAARVFALPAEGLRLGLDDPAAPGREDRQGETRRHERAATLAKVLGRLAPDVSPADREFVAEAAGRLAQAGTDAEAEAVLTEVRLRVRQANERTAARREERRRQAELRDAAAQAEAERRYVQDAVTAAFEELGYEVDTGFETLTARDGEVVLSRGAWPDHRVRMRVEDDRTIRAAIVRTRAPESEEDRRLDVEREHQWCEAFEEARRRLAAAGVTATVTWRIEPGEHELPVVSRARQTRARTRQRARERGRERET